MNKSQIIFFPVKVIYEGMSDLENFGIKHWLSQSKCNLEFFNKVKKKNRMYVKKKHVLS